MRLSLLPRGRVYDPCMPPCVSPATLTCVRPAVCLCVCVQFADPGSVSFLRLLVQQSADSKLLVVLSEHTSPDRPSVVESIANDSLWTHTVLDVRPLTLNATQDLVRVVAHLSEDTAAVVGQALFRGVGGNPGAVVKALRVMYESGQLVFDVDSGVWTVGEGVVGPTEAEFAGALFRPALLHPAAQKVLGVCAVVGTVCTLTEVRSVPWGGEWPPP